MKNTISALCVFLRPSLKIQTAFRSYYSTLQHAMLRQLLAHQVALPTGLIRFIPSPTVFSATKSLLLPPIQQAQTQNPIAPDKGATTSSDSKNQEMYQPTHLMARYIYSTWREGNIVAFIVHLCLFCSKVACNYYTVECNFYTLSCMQLLRRVECNITVAYNIIFTHLHATIRQLNVILHS